MASRTIAAVVAALALGAAGGAAAQQASTPANAPSPASSADADAAAAGKLVLLFGSGSARLDEQDQALLDKASRLYRDGKPIVMIVSGSADTVGSPAQNLLLSQQRANAVARGLMARGIPADRTQILAKGETALPVQTAKGVAEPQNRRAEITWR